VGKVLYRIKERFLIHKYSYRVHGGKPIKKESTPHEKTSFSFYLFMYTTEGWRCHDKKHCVQAFLTCHMEILLEDCMQEQGKNVF